MIKQMVFLIILIFIAYEQTAFASFNEELYRKAYLIGKQSAEYAMNKMLKPQKGKIFVVTNAGFVRIDGIESSPALDAVSNVTGSTTGRGNLLSLQSSSEKTLFFFFYNPDKGDSLYLEVGEPALKDKKINFKKLKYEKNFLSLIQEREAFEKLTKEKLMGGNEYRLLMITSLWLKGIPMEMRNSISFHDHFCPGVTSGFYIAEFLKNEFKLAENESYYIIASPPWCKDDALQVMLNATVGKRSMAVMPLKDEDIKCLKEEVKKTAGIYFKQSRTQKTAKGVVLSFDWDKIRKDAGIEALQQRESISDRVRLAVFMYENLKNYKKYVSVIKEINLSEGESPDDYARAGVNPWKKLELWNENCKN